MEVGKMRHKVTIKTLSTAQNTYGERDTWIDFATLHASKEPLLGNEYFRAEAVQSKVEVKFRTRYIPGITEAMRIHHGTEEVYEILSAINVESRNRELLIYARRLVI